MGELLSTFVVPLKKNVENSKKQMISLQDLNTIFFKIEDIFNWHCKVASYLGKVDKDSKWPIVEGFGHTIYSLLDDIVKEVHVYSANLKKALDAFTFCVVKNVLFKDFVQSQTVRNKRKNLKEFLNFPLQHLRHYADTCRIFFLCTPPTSEEFGQACDSWMVMHQLQYLLELTLANEADSQKLYSVNLRLDTSSKPFELLRQGRILVKEGSITFSSKEFYCFLFNDCFLLTRSDPFSVFFCFFCS